MVAMPAAAGTAVCWLVCTGVFEAWDILVTGVDCQATMASGMQLALKGYVFCIDQMAGPRVWKDFMDGKGLPEEFRPARLKG
jgi:hypothetical protein